MTDGIEQVTGRLEAVLRNAATTKTESTITKALIQAGAYAAQLTPVDTSNLINSQGRQVTPTPRGYKGTLFYGADYAFYVHSAPGTLLGENVPRNTARPGSGNVWDPNGEPEFLRKAGERVAREDAPRIVREEMSL